MRRKMKLPRTTTFTLIRSQTGATRSPLRGQPVSSQPNLTLDVTISVRLRKTLLAQTWSRSSSTNSLNLLAKRQELRDREVKI